jgi:glycosyltransferase involved in cell wall biosynthesis
MLYVGLISMARGLDFVIRTLPLLLEKGIDGTLVIVGRGGAEERLKELVRKLDVADRVFFEGYVDREAVPQYVASSDICLIPYPYCGHWAHTIPNKLFDYMATSKPVIVSDVEPMRRIVTETGCGIVYKCSDRQSFSECVRTLCEEGTREAMGKSGEQAVRQRYNWDVDSGELLRVFGQFSRGVKPGM